MEEELKRSEERASMCDSKIKELENELRAVGESMKAGNLNSFTAQSNNSKLCCRRWRCERRRR